MLTINLSAVAQNYKLLARKAPAVAGIIKANAYGLGMKEIVSVLEKENCPFYFVATLDEALMLRPLTNKPIAVLNGIQGHKDLSGFVANNIWPVLNSLLDIQNWRGDAILHFDTGINRLGIADEETQHLLARPELLHHINVKMVISHFACADDKDHPMTNRQYEQFLSICHHFPQAQKSLANSSGLFRAADYHFDMVRPGMALYGLNPVPETKNPMRQVIRLDVPLLQTKTVKKGEAVGYGRTYVLGEDKTIGTISLGYADGFLRSLSNKGTLYYNNVLCPVIGRVSMDLVTIDLGTTNAQPGEMIEIIGTNQSADQLAATAGTIGYEVLTNLGQRYPRRYTSM